MITIQITLYSSSNKYKPMSTLVEVPSREYYTKHAAEVNASAIDKILIKRKMSAWVAKKYGYTKLSARVYDKERIERENIERYEQIKKERGWT